MCPVLTLQWRHNGSDGVSNHQPHDCFLMRLFRRSWKKTSKLHVTGLCEGNSLVTGEFPAQRASNAENVSFWWRHRDNHTQPCAANRERGPVSIYDKTSYSKVSQILKTARFVFRIVWSLRNLTGTSTAVLPKFLLISNLCDNFKLPISRLRDFTRSYDKTSYRILKRGPVYFFGDRSKRTGFWIR